MSRFRAWSVMLLCVPQLLYCAEVQGPRFSANDIVIDYTLGELLRPDSMKEPSLCAIKMGMIPTADIDKFYASIAAAQKAEYQVAFHMVARNPSLTIWVYLPRANSNSPVEKFLLFQDSESLKYKSGPEADYLGTLARKLCKSK